MHDALLKSLTPQQEEGAPLAPEFAPGDTEEERMRDKSYYWCIGEQYFWHETEITKDEYIRAKGADQTCD